MSIASIRTILAAFAIVSGVGFYIYGPAVTPLMNASAAASCNEITGGSFRGYHLEWVVGSRPHWGCWDNRDPAAAPVNLGWWVTPGG